MSSLMLQKEENSIWHFLLSGVDITPSVTNSTKLMAPQGFSILWEAVTSYRSLFYLLKAQLPGLCKTQTTDHLLLTTAITEKISYLWHFFHCQASSAFLSTAEDMLCWLHSWFLCASHFPLPGTQNLSPEHALHLGKLPLLFQLVDRHKALPSPQSSQKKSSRAPHFQREYLWVLYIRSSCLRGSFTVLL